jgi:hypothetical protein
VGFRGSGDIADLQVPFLAQIYGDRATSENAFNELNNKWRWASFTTRDLKHCQIMARLIALVCDWWSLFALLSDPNHHREAITSRPLLSHGPGATNPPRQPNPPDGDLLRRGPVASGVPPLADHQVIPRRAAICGAVDDRGKMAAHPCRSAMYVSPWTTTGPDALASSPLGCT